MEPERKKGMSQLNCRNGLPEPFDFWVGYCQASKPQRRFVPLQGQGGLSCIKLEGF
jgi:hypothetical protein